MERELSNLRKAMNSSTHKGVHFTEIQKEKIRASLHQEEIKEKRKPKLSIAVITTLAASLFILLFYTDIAANLSSNGAEQMAEGEWKVRNEYSRNGKLLFRVFPDPNLSAGKRFGYLFSFKEPFDAYKGKEMEIFATQKGTGERIKVLPSEKITEPSSGYASLGRFTAMLTVPKGGLWKYEVFFDKKLYGDVVLPVGEGILLPFDIPNFVQTSDFEKIDWNRKAVDLGDNIIGNAHQSGVIGPDLPSININQKWMWHLWGIENPEEVNLTVVGFHRETGTIHQLLTAGWTTGLMGENHGADAHIPSSVNIPQAGEWAVVLYVDGKLFDVLVYNINK